MKNKNTNNNQASNSFDKKSHRIVGRNLEYQDDANTNESSIKFFNTEPDTKDSNLNPNSGSNYNLYNDDEIIKDSQEILNVLTPKFEKIKQKEKQLDTLSSQASEIITNYQQNQNNANILIEEYNLKKEKLKKIYLQLNYYKEEIRQKTIALDKQEKELQSFEQEIIEKNNQLNINKEIFDNYLQEKSQEIDNRANEIKSEMEELEQWKTSLKEKENELLENEKNITRKKKKLENEKYDFEIMKKEFELQKEEKDLNSKGIQNSPKKVNEVMKIIPNMNNFPKETDMKEIFTLDSQRSQEEHHTIQKQFQFQFQGDDLEKKETTMPVIQFNLPDPEIDNKQATLDNLNQEIRRKHEELEGIQMQCFKINQDVVRKLTEIEERQKRIDLKEREINLLRQDLDEKLSEVETKLDETRKLSQEMKDKEEYFNRMRTIDKNLDLKISAMELNETLAKKKFALQQRRLNELANLKMMNMNINMSNNNNNTNNYNNHSTSKLHQTVNSFSCGSPEQSRSKQLQK